MRFKFILIVLAILSAHAFSQSKNVISVVYGTTGNSVDVPGSITNKSLVIPGIFSYDGTGGTTLGFNYERYFSNSFSLQTGFLVSDDKIQYNDVTPTGIETTAGDIKMISIPVLAKFTFLKYLFIDGGLITSLQTNYYSPQPLLVFSLYPPAYSPPVGYQPNYTNKAIVNNQSGIGLELGIGAKYNFGPATIAVNPYLQQHDVIPLSGNGNSNGNGVPYNLFDSGFKFSAGYKF